MNIPAIAAALVLLVAPGHAAVPRPADPVRAAVQAALPAVQRSGEEWYESRSCSSCHHAALDLVAVSATRERGWAVDEELASRLLARYQRSSIDANAEIVQGDAGINAQIGQSYRLLALTASAVPPNATTDAVTHFLLGKQHLDGRWASESHRPPLEDSEFTATALSVRAIRRYAPPGLAAEVASRVRRAHAWLGAAVPRDNEERVMRLLGLLWADGTPDELAAASAALRREQCEDGGWAQIPSRASDAFATGEALVALREAGGVPADDPCVQRGVAFLLRTQQADGTWLVETRRLTEGLAHFETGFPHGVHQFISCAGTSWAIAGLCAAAAEAPSPIWTATAALPRPPAAAAVRAVAAAPGAAEPAPAPTDRAPTAAAIAAPGTPAAPAASTVAVGTPAAAGASPDDDDLPPLLRAALYGDLASMQALLDAGADCNVRGPRGLTPLIGAAGDPARVRLLLDHGADFMARSELGRTALHVAAASDGGFDALQLLLAAGRDALPAGDDDSSAAAHDSAHKAAHDSAHESANDAAPEAARAADLDEALRLAAIAGDLRKVDLLLDAGAHVDARGDEGATALGLSGWQGDAAMVRHLIARGADPESEVQGATPLLNAVIDGQDAVVAVLLEAGASLEVRDTMEPHDAQVEGIQLQCHLTPLLWAVTCDHGSTAALQALLAKGADLHARDEHDATALQRAEAYGYARLAALLRAAGASE